MTKEIQEKNVISITVRDRMAVLISPRAIVSDNTGYVVRFDFDEEWGAYDTKTVWFVRDDGTCCPPAVIKEEGQCSLPRINGTGHIRIGVTAGDIHTSTAASLTVLPSVLEIAGQVLEADPTAPAAVWDWILEKLSAIEQNSAVQPDWLQNDESAGDYIKNRPFYERTVEKAKLTMTGTTVSETELSVTFNWGELEPLAYGGVTAIAYGGIRKPCSLSLSDSDGTIYVAVDGALLVSVNPSYAYTKTVTLAGEGFTEAEYPVELIGESTEIKPIDEKFLPDTAATFKGVPENRVLVSTGNGKYESQPFSILSIDKSGYAVPLVRELNYVVPLEVGETVSYSASAYNTPGIFFGNAEMYNYIFRNTDTANTIVVPFSVYRNDADGKYYWTGIGYGYNYVTGEGAGVYSFRAVADGWSDVPVTITRLM